MADIKTKVRGTVKTIDKTVNTSARIKGNIVSTKDKLENTYMFDLDLTYKCHQLLIC